MTLPEIARFLDEHPDFAPVLMENIRGNLFVEGFTSPEHNGNHYLSVREIEQTLAASPAKDIQP